MSSYIEIDKNNKVLYALSDFTLLGKTEEQLLETGYIVDSVPQVPPMQGKDGMLYYNPETKEFYFEYVDRPLTPQEEIESLKAQNAQMLLVLVEGGLM